MNRLFDNRRRVLISKTCSPITATMREAFNRQGAKLWTESHLDAWAEDVLWDGSLAVPANIDIDSTEEQEWIRSHPLLIEVFESIPVGLRGDWQVVVLPERVVGNWIVKIDEDAEWEGLSERSSWTF